jgi:hypothetical protein
MEKITVTIHDNVSGPGPDVQIAADLYIKWKAGDTYSYQGRQRTVTHKSVELYDESEALYTVYLD